MVSFQSILFQYFFTYFHNFLNSHFHLTYIFSFNFYSGFSNTAVRILDALNTPYETVNVLEDNEIRNGIKLYSSWPTIPQLYINKEFVDGSDIMIELYQNGQLAEMIELANAN